LWNDFLSGFVAGTVNSFVVAPIELIRTSQILSGKNSNQRSTFFYCVKGMSRQYGLLGMWKGVIPTICRDGPGMAFYFLSFNYWKSGLQLMVKEQIETPLWVRILAGSFAGIAFWAWALPMDTIKTVIEASIIQQAGYNVLGKKDNIIDEMGNLSKLEISRKNRKPFWMLGECVWGVLRSRGLLGLYSAWPAALGRGIPAAAVTLTTYDLCTEYIMSNWR